MDGQQDFQGRVQEVYRVAGELYGQRPDWVLFFREVLGVDGAARRLFSADEMAEFQCTGEYTLIQEMLTRLRERGQTKEEPEAIQVVTVRLPKSLHAALKTEARERQTSLQQLCVTKLLRPCEANG